MKKKTLGKTLLALAVGGTILFWSSGSVEGELKESEIFSRKNSVSLLSHKTSWENSPSWAKFAYSRRVGNGHSLGFDMQYVNPLRSFLSGAEYSAEVQVKQNVNLGGFVTSFVGMDFPLFRYDESLRFDTKKGISENFGFSLDFWRDKSLLFKGAFESDNTFSGKVELRHKF